MKFGSFPKAVLWVWVLSGLFGCTPTPPSASQSLATPQAPAPAKGAASKSFETQGDLESMDLQKRKLKIRHDKIPDYMPSMTMEFDVRDSSDLSTLKPGDRLSFTMKVTDDDGWIESVRKIQTASAQPPATSSSVTNRQILPVAELLPVGASIPDYTFTNQLGHVTRFSDLKGQVFAFTFIFTTCPFPTMCPKMSNNLKGAQDRLKSDGGVATNWQFLSITIDPRIDTPEVLARYAEMHGADPGHWSYLTGNEDEINELGLRFGLNFFRTGASLNHNLRTVVVDREGRLQRVFIGNEWTPDQLVDEVKKALASPAKP